MLIYYTNYPKPPRIYNRTYNLRDNVINDNIPGGSLGGNEYGAWIQFSANGMNNYTDGGDKFQIVDSFMEGIHGRPSVQVDSPSPQELMQQFQEGYKKRTLDGYFRSLGYTVSK